MSTRTWWSALEDAARGPRAGEDAFVFAAPTWCSRLTFAAWRRSSHVMAAGLAALGVGRGDRVAVASPGSPIWPVAQTACSHLGAILVPVNVRYRRDELAHVLALARPRVLCAVETVHVHDLRRLLEEAIAEAGERGAPAPTAVWLTSPDLELHTARAGAPDVAPAADPGAASSWAEFRALAGAAPVPAPAGRADDPVLLQFTSGTTAFPKGALLDSTATLGTAHHLAERMGLTERDTVFSTQPYYHVGGTVATTLIALTHGCTMVSPERYTPDEVFRLVRELGCTARSGQAAMYAAELAHPDFSPEHFRTVRRGWAVGTPQLMRAIRERMGVEHVVPLYGLTEAAGISTAAAWDDDPDVRDATAGRALPGLELGILANGAVSTEPGPTGEVCVRGWALMRGYYEDPDATAAAIDADGWLHTGDLGRLDERGYLHFVDRLKDMIKPGGENVAAAEVERVIAELDGVDRVAVVGMPDERLGEVPAAFVELRAGTGLDPDSIVQHCAVRMASFKVPRRVLETSDWPVTESGKVQKHLLKQRLADVGRAAGTVGTSG